MFIFHIALQGCLKKPPIAYGSTADTGGHIKYLLELVDAMTHHTAVTRIEMATRAFDDGFEVIFSQHRERYNHKTDIVRFEGATTKYLAKEELWQENEVYAQNVIKYLQSLPKLPDVIHAHYADAGWVAAKIKQVLGIPFIFTAHSLGRVKVACKKTEAARKQAYQDMFKRIAIEEAAIKEADLIIASSRDEAEGQYALYENTRPEKIRINAPGCDLACFMETQYTAIPQRITDNIERFLSAPYKPIIFTIARPVRKKNLAGLVRAYGENTALQDKANLVIFAGVRDDLEAEVDENRDVLKELLYLIDKYDLHGKVALPKHHKPEDVPLIYRYAQRHKGVFVNPAFNEPFGLTLLEAAASGLPIVATNSGGPNDILERLESGTLVNPEKPAEIATAVLDITAKKDRWNKLAFDGLQNTQYYSWTRHVDDYVIAARRTIEQTKRTSTNNTVINRRNRPNALLATDIDNTLVGDTLALKRFSDWIRTQNDYVYAVATGRSLHSSLSILQQTNAPLPEIFITSVGTEIYYRLENGLLKADKDWAATLTDQWNIQRVQEVMRSFNSVKPQSLLEQRKFKASYFAPDDKKLINKIRMTFDDEGVKANVIFSHGQYLDILPHHASKGEALGFLGNKLGIPVENIVAAGDSGNDLAMLQFSHKPIIVGNYAPDLESLRCVSGTYFAKGTYASGILEGLERYTPDLSRKQIMKVVADVTE